MHQEPGHVEVSWHRHLEAAIRKARQYRSLDGRGYSVDLVYVRAARSGRARTRTPVARQTRFWSVGPAEEA